MTRRPTRTLAARLATPVVLVPLALGACSGGDGDLAPALAGGGSGRSGGASESGDRPGQAPPAPEDVAGAFDDAIDLQVRAFDQRVEAPAPPPEDETVDADEGPEMVDLLAESL